MWEYHEGCQCGLLLGGGQCGNSVGMSMWEHCGNTIGDVIVGHCGGVNVGLLWKMSRWGTVVDVNVEILRVQCGNIVGDVNVGILWGMSM